MLKISFGPTPRANPPESNQSTGGGKAQRFTYFSCGIGMTGMIGTTRTDVNQYFHLFCLACSRTFWWCNLLLPGCLYTCPNLMLKIWFAVGGSKLGISCNRHLMHRIGGTLWASVSASVWVPIHRIGGMASPIPLIT